MNRGAAALYLIAAIALCPQTLSQTTGSCSGAGFDKGRVAGAGRTPLYTGKPAGIANSEVDAQTTSFGTDSASAPVGIHAITSRCETWLHSEAYLYARPPDLNTPSLINDSFGKPMVPSQHYCADADIGGPSLLSGLHDFTGTKILLFRAGYEYCAGIRAGGFSLASIGVLCPGGYSNAGPFCVQHRGALPNGKLIVNGIIPATAIDPCARALRGRPITITQQNTGAFYAQAEGKITPELTLTYNLP
jgi:hypothetical protein